MMQKRKTKSPKTQRQKRERLPQDRQRLEQKPKDPDALKVLKEWRKTEIDLLERQLQIMRAQQFPTTECRTLLRRIQRLKRGEIP
jgi:hypothetical protein